MPRVYRVELLIVDSLGPCTTEKELKDVLELAVDARVVSVQTRDVSNDTSMKLTTDDAWNEAYEEVFELGEES